MLVRVGLIAAALGAAGTSAIAADDAASRIRDLEHNWVDAIHTGDAAKVADFYAKDAVLLPTGQPRQQGRDAIQAWWKAAMAMPAFALDFSPDKIVVSNGGDMAYALGTYTMRFDSDNGPVQDKGKYVDVWMRTDGGWKATADIFNSDGAR